MTTLPKISELSVRQKIQMMESLWDSLCQQPTNIPSPVWHGEILAQRENALREGSDYFSAWDTAKANLRKSTR
ncbi:addiction module antitoxin RelB [Acidithiobacillus marinus]|uniref:Addiction module antitoxin RelB n=1 Tax=Acidithiobacillus marinus TaxID=187490 RepID=A0A2I1DM67_9PROT|nr:addiction module protein [Acidithiobacillus marinus]PKY10968.1 addiction module antitoxin RelB [Acidithiobacillus marinus]